MAWVAIALAVATTYAIQISTMAHLKSALKETGWSGAGSPGGGGVVGVLPALLRPGDWLLLGLLGLAVLLLVDSERRGRHVTRMLREGVSTRRGAIWMLLVISAMAVRPYFDAGIPHAFDAKLHFAKVVEVSESIAAWEWPTWTWRWYSGFPLLRFYAPLYYLAAASLQLLLPGAATGPKALLVLCHLASGIGMYLYARSLTGSRPAAVVASAIYLLCYQRYHGLLSLGRHPEAPVYALLPFVLWSLERFAQSRNAAIGLVTGGLLGLCALSHTMLGAFCSVLSAVYLLVRWLATPALRRPPARMLAYGGLCALAALTLLAFWLVPALAEQEFVQLGGMGANRPDRLLPAPTLKSDLWHLVKWGSPTRRGSSIAYVGLTVIGLGIPGFLRLLRRHPDRALALAGLLGTTLLYVCGSYFQARCVVILAPVLAVAAGSAFSGDRAPSSRGAWALLLLLLDLLPLTAFSPFRPDLAGVQRELGRMAPRFAACKVVVASTRGGTPEVSQWTGWDSSRMAVLGGPFREGATPVFSWNMALLDAVALDLEAAGPLDPDTVRAMRLFGVAAIVLEDGSGLAPPPIEPGEGYRISSSPPAVILDDHSPAVFCMTAGPGPAAIASLSTDRPLYDLPGPEDAPDWRAALRSLVRAAEADAGCSTARIALLAPGESLEGAEEDVRTGPPPSFTRPSVERRAVGFTVDVETAGFLILPFAAYPGVRVALDGRTVPAARTVTGTLAIALPSGSHRVAVRGPSAPTVVWGRWVTGGGLAVLALLAAFSARPRRGGPG